MPRLSSMPAMPWRIARHCPLARQLFNVRVGVNSRQQYVLVTGNSGQ